MLTDVQWDPSSRRALHCVSLIALECLSPRYVITAVTQPMQNEPGLQFNHISRYGGRDFGNPGLEASSTVWKPALRFGHSRLVSGLQQVEARVAQGRVLHRQQKEKLWQIAAAFVFTAVSCRLSPSLGLRHLQ